jgi:hypothetical protein
MKKYILKIDGVRKECNEEDAKKILRELEENGKYYIEKYEIEDTRIVIAYSTPNTQGSVT